MLQAGSSLVDCLLQLVLKEQMGETLSKIFCCNIGTKEIRILMLGLDNAGKTTTLYKLKCNQLVTTVPTVGFNVECYLQGNTKLNIWDIGGQDKIRPLWRHYYAGSKGLVFVIDSHDRDRLPEARQELVRILKDREMRDCPILIFANKQDLPDALTDTEIIEGLGIVSLTERDHRPWQLQKSCAVEGEGLWDGLNWLVKTIKSTKPSNNQ